MFRNENDVVIKKSKSREIAKRPTPSQHLQHPRSIPQTRAAALCHGISVDLLDEPTLQERAINFFVSNSTKLGSHL